VTEPMDAGEAITMGIFELEHAITPHYEADDSRRAIESLQSLRARLTSIIERQEKERAESESFCKGHSDGNSRIEGYAALVQCPNCGVVHSALTERAKP